MEQELTQLYYCNLCDFEVPVNTANPPNNAIASIQDHLLNNEGHSVSVKLVIYND